ncbi:putative ubiquitin [Brazilian marseillevirus]|uniref:putative ubiquitin n=1 Tax=Brazilian marseillevirus TaxID=1813599 RepID=UPI0007807A65|nr:putative ubiquitin [Brazilian marseillevirus]AMQ10810.1 putative ubiquitin [Brazilian marseillevirus]
MTKYYGTMQLFVKRFTERKVVTHTIDVDGDATVELLKHMIWQKTGILTSKQKLYCNGRCGFSNDAIIRNAFIKESTIFLS